MGDFINNFFDPLTGYTSLPRIDSSLVAPTNPISSNLVALTDLMSLTLTAPNFFLGGMASGNQGIRITAAGTFASNLNVKTVNLLFGSTLLASVSGAFNGGSWRFDGMVFRITDTSQTASTLVYSGAGGATTDLYNTNPAENTQVNITIKCQGQGILSGDVTQTLLTIANN